MAHDPRYQGKRGLWDDYKLKQAVCAVVQYGVSKKKASKEYGIPRVTLIRHVIMARQGKGVEKRLGRPQLLDEAEEAELSKVIEDMESRLYGLTESDVKKIVYSYCSKKGIKHTFNEEYKAAGRVWMRGFMRRHPELSLRKPQAVSIQRAIGFNADKVDRFYNLLEETVYTDQGERKIPARNLFNVDETGITVVHKPCRILAKKGKKYVGSLTSGERGKTITAICCASATGIYVSPMLIFPRVRMKPSLMDHCAPGAIGTCTKTGWINEKVFSDWFEHFLTEVQPQSRQQPVLLIFDGHTSHTRNLKVIEKARENNVVLLCLPSHTSHQLQPLDISFFRSLKSKYDEQVRLWLRNHAGRKLCEDQIAEIFGNAYQNAASLKNAIGGFRKAGIEPFDRDSYKENDYSGALMTYEPSPCENVASTTHVDVAEDISRVADDNLELHCCDVEPDDPVADDIAESNQVANSDVESRGAAEGSSIIADNTQITDISLLGADRAEADVGNVTFQEFAACHKSYPPSSSRKKRKVAHAEILTTSPYKRTLEAARAENANREERRGIRRSKVSVKKTKKQSTKPSRNKNKNEKSRNGNEDVTPCSTCGQRFCDDKTGSKWVKCQNCHRWFHNACQGLPEKMQRKLTLTFVCIECADCS
jgi:hypothetical protein